MRTVVELIRLTIRSPTDSSRPVKYRSVTNGLLFFTYLVPAVVLARSRFLITEKSFQLCKLYSKHQLKTLVNSVLTSEGLGMRLLLLAN